MKKGSEKMYHKAKKSLGQNFLKSAQALSTIVRASRLAPTDTVLEVGPGKGVLTKELLKQSKVIAVEKDRELISHLKETFRDHCDSGKLRLIEGDILEMSPQDLNLNNHSFKIVANLPYYITGQFLRQWLSGDIQPSHMTLMLQKEVAKRIVAHDGKESILSISVKAYGTPRYIETVKAKYFS
jgi:16S rRNA (adenine1518-N6/adenine1519-N6)-dimethyltransferase